MIKLKKVCFKCKTFLPRIGGGGYKCAMQKSCPGLNWSTAKKEKAFKKHLDRTRALMEKVAKGGLGKFRHKNPIPDEKGCNLDTMEAKIKGNMSDVFPIGNPRGTFLEES